MCSYGFNEIEYLLHYGNELWGSNSLINFSDALKLDKKPAKATSKDGLNPKPPFAIGNVAWLQADSKSWIFKISINDSQIIVS